MSNLLRQGPTGRFLACDEALRAWLPTLLGEAYHRPLQTLLEAAELWCERQAGLDYQHAAEALKGNPGNPDRSLDRRYCAARVKDAERWLRKAEILRETIGRLAEVDQPR